MGRIDNGQQNTTKEQINISTKMQKSKTEAPMMEDETHKRIAALKSRPIPAAKRKSSIMILINHCTFHPRRRGRNPANSPALRKKSCLALSPPSAFLVP
jgi:hypothetical protein